MIIKIEHCPAKDGRSPTAYIRLFPETNREMADLEWIRQCGLQAKPELLANSIDEMMYTIVFKLPFGTSLTPVQLLEKLVDPS